MAMNKIKLHFNTERQEIDGFGASGFGYSSKNIKRHKYCDDIMTLLFDKEKGAGLSILRSGIGDSADNWGDDKNGPEGSIEPQEGVWDWNVNDTQIWLMQEAKKYGCERFYSVPWSPPAWMKENACCSKGKLRKDMYRKMAEYLAEYVLGYKEHFGIDIYAISPQNEPESEPPYSSCKYTPEDLCEFVRDHLGPVFRERNVPAKIMMMEAANYDFDLVEDTVNDPEALKYVDLFSAHGYWRDPPIKFEKAFELGKKVWQTEYCNIFERCSDIKDGVRWARIIHEHMVTAESSAFFYWYLANQYYHNDEPLIHINIDNHTFVVNKRLWTFANFSRFIRPGFVRVDMEVESLDDVKITTRPDPEVVLPPRDTIKEMFRTAAPAGYVSAYKNPDTGALVVVAVNDTEENLTVQLDLSESLKVDFEVYRTSEDENMQMLHDVKTRDGILEVTLRPMSVTTYRSK